MKEFIMIIMLNQRKIFVILFFLVFSLCFGAVGYCQEETRKVEITSSIGIRSFDSDLAFESTPSFGLEAGYRVAKMMQLRLGFSFNPTEQRISLATSQLTNEFIVYHYILSLRFSSKKPMLSKLIPFVNIGAGGMIIDPKSSVNTIDVGAGQTVAVGISTDHKFGFNIGAGFSIPISNKNQIRFEYQSLFYRLRGFQTSTKVARNGYWGLSLSTFF